MKTKEYYTVKEAAKILDVTPKSVWKWIEIGRMKAEQEYVKGEGWGKNCYKIALSELIREKNVIPACLWCKKPMTQAKYRRKRKYCNAKHQYLYHKSQRS